MALPGLVAANNLSDVVDREKAWDNLGENIDYPGGERYYRQVSLLLHGDGSNGSTTITDSSPAPKIVTAFGNAQISTAQSKFGGSSIAFDGTGDYLTIPSSNDFAIGTQDFTIEGWVWVPSSPASFPQLFSIQGTDALFVNFRGGLILGLTDTGTVYATSPATPASEWFHFAVTRTNSLARVFVNGISGSAGACTQSFGAISQTGAAIGLSNTGTFNGYIDDLRVTKGVARYTANFTPPTAPFPDFF